MRQTLGILLTGTLVLAWSAPVRPGEGDDAKAIVDKAIQAVGGEAKLAKHKATTWKEKGIYYGMGKPLPYVGNYAVQWPGQFRMEIEGVFTMVINGKKGWMKNKDETMEIPQEQLESQIKDHQAGWIATLVPLKNKAFKLAALGEVKVGKKPALGVQVTRKHYPDVKLYFDKKSGLLIKSAFKTKAAEEGFKEMTMEVTYSDYRDVDGVKVPHKHVMKRDGKQFVEAEVVEITAAGKLDNKMFARP